MTDPGAAAASRIRERMRRTTYDREDVALIHRDAGNGSYGVNSAMVHRLAYTALVAMGERTDVEPQP